MIDSHYQPLPRTLTEYRAANQRLYRAFKEVGDILEQGKKEGEKGYKRAIYKALEVLGGVE